MTENNIYNQLFDNHSCCIKMNSNNIYYQLFDGEYHSHTYRAKSAIYESNYYRYMLKIFNNNKYLVLRFYIVQIHS